MLKHQQTFFICIIMTLITGCSSQKQNIGLNSEKVYTEIEMSVEKHNLLEHDTEYFKAKKFNPAKKIFSELKDKLQNVNHIIFLFSWVNHLPTAGTKDFVSIVYDIDNNKKYYCYNFVKNYKTIIIEENLPENFLTAETVVNSCKQNNIEYIRTLQNRYSSAEIGQDYLVVEINLLKKTDKTMVFKRVALE